MREREMRWRLRASLGRVAVLGAVVALGAAFARSETGSPPLDCSEALDALIAWWPGDGSTESIVGTDDMDGLEESTAAYATGTAGSSFDLDGTSAYVKVADSESLTTPDGFTVQAWIRPSTIEGPRTIVSKWDDVGQDWSFNFKLNNEDWGKVRFELSHGDDHEGLGNLIGPTVVPTDEWTHVAATYDTASGMMRIYVNGQMDAEAHANDVDGTPVGDSSTPLLIGAVYTGLSEGDMMEFFQGQIDEVLLFGRALTADEILANYEGGLEAHCKPCLTVAPDLEAGASPGVLWPPDHEMVDVAIRLEASGEDAAELAVTCTVRSDQPDDGVADGSTTGDVDGQDGYAGPVDVTLAWDATEAAWVGTVALRAERSGTSSAGRTYTITCRATNACGLSSTASATVLVPHEQ